MRHGYAWMKNGNLCSLSFFDEYKVKAKSFDMGHFRSWKKRNIHRKICAKKVFNNEEVFGMIPNKHFWEIEIRGKVRNMTAFFRSKSSFY